MKTVAVYGLSRTTRLKLKLLAAVQGKTMSEMVTELIEQAFNSNETELSEQTKRRIRKIVRQWRP